MGIDFQPLTLKHKSTVEKYMFPFGEGSCQHSFTGMFYTNDKYAHAVCETEGALLVRREKLGDERFRVYLMPMGQGDIAPALKKLRADARAHSALIKLETVTEKAKDMMEARFPGMFITEEARDYAEYLYFTDKLAELPGSSLSGKRRDVNHFWRRYEGRIRIKDMAAEDAGEVRAFQSAWLKEREGREDFCHLLREDAAVARGLENFNALGLRGILLYVDGALRGFAYGAQISNDTFDIMAEKGDTRIKDIYRVLNMENVRRCCAGLRYVNYEEDIGLPGLRKLKLSYKPDILMKKYIMKEAAGVE
ncbi:MAG: phosphatidylglycerol lysyltransferase domain-containing protein [Clostridiales bacterium]|nr:phosphatidylglycerol lysyltransferase domain-containing protein [Clostridiales bacterium]